MNAQPGDKVSFKTPKGRELRGRVLMRGDWQLAVVTESPRMTFIVHEDDVIIFQETLTTR